MSDARLKEYSTLEGVTMDFLLLDTGRLDEREELATAARVALGTDRLADAKEILPDLDSTDRRGWWGDFEAEDIWGGWPIGCKNWLLARAKITEAPAMEGSTLGRARQYTIDALQPFVDKRIASQFSVTAARTELQRIEVNAQIYRGPADEIDLRYQLLWQEEPITETFVVAKTNKTIRIPYSNLKLTPTPPLMSKVITTANLLFSTTAPLILYKVKEPFVKSDWPNPKPRKLRPPPTVKSFSAVTITRIYLTNTGAGQQWLVPADWNNAVNTIECIGAGANGQTGTNSNASSGGGGGNGGGAGAYAKISNLTLTPSSLTPYAVGAANSGIDTSFNTSSVIADSAIANIAGTVANSTGTIKFRGGFGGAGNAAGASTGGGGGGAGGGTASETADGSHGSSGGTGFVDGNGGAGGNGGYSGSGAPGAIGGAQTVWLPNNGGNGSPGTQYDSTHGSGGGGGGGSGGGNRASTAGPEGGGFGGFGGTYGAGGGGGGGGSYGGNGNNGAGGGGGRQGLIIITYSPLTSPVGGTGS